MSERGPRLGWTLGGLGGLLWLVILAVVLLVQGNYPGALTSAAFFVAGVLYLVIFAPWKHENTPFWRIYLGFVLFVIGAAAILLVLWYPGEIKSLRRFHLLFCLIPLFIPVFIMGRKTWSDVHKE